MEQVRRKLLQAQPDVLNNSANDKLREYQANMKKFISLVEAEISAIIAKYQTQIKELKEKNQYLSKQLANRPTATVSNLMGFDSNLQPTAASLSPVKRKRKLIDNFDTAQSNFFSTLKSPFESDAFFPPETQNRQFEAIGDRMQRSRFQARSNEKKQRHEYLIQSLQMGKSNLDLNTGKMFTLIGHSKQQEETTSIENEQMREQKLGTRKKKARFEDSHNTSLSEICGSLDNSFHAKKAQQRSNKKRKAKEDKEQEDRVKEQAQEKLKKEQGIKNVLKAMRHNITDIHQKPEIIKASKLLTTGEKGQSQVKLQRSKVMINPVPVDAIRRSAHKEDLTPESPQRAALPSILKKSKNTLTRSISNISAISFHSSGGED